MKKILFFLLMCVLGSISVNAQSKKYTMSVIVTGNLDETGRNIVNSALMQRLSGNKEYVVFERNTAFIKALTKEQDFQLNGDVPESQIRKVGARMGVDYVAVANVEYICDGICSISARIINLETGQVIKTCNEQREYENSQTLRAMANNVAFRLFSKPSK
ncbi:MAG: hypothetical protein HDS46_03620 [Bacteroides sp.]|nr:hypothetical protein [Bacteroides sp.]